MPVWTFEQGVGNNNNNALAFPGDVKADSLLVIAQGGDNNGAQPSTPTDSKGNTWNLIRFMNDATDDFTLTWWYAISNGAGADTVTFQGLLDFDCHILVEFSVDSGTIEIDESGGTAIENGSVANHTNAADNISSGNITPTVDDTLILCTAIETSALVTFTQGTNYTERAATELPPPAPSGAPFKLESRTLASPAAVAGTWTAGASGRASCFAAAFRAVGGPPPTAQNQLAWIRA